MVLQIFCFTEFVPSHDLLEGCLGVVETVNRRAVWSSLHQFRIFDSLLRNLPHHSDEAIKGFLAFAFGRLDHQSLMEKQWEIDSGCMVAVVEQTLSHVESGNASALVLQAVEHKFVLANALDRQFVAFSDSLM